MSIFGGKSTKSNLSDEAFEEYGSLSRKDLTKFEKRPGNFFIESSDFSISSIFTAEYSSPSRRLGVIARFDENDLVYPVYESTMELLLDFPAFR